MSENENDTTHPLGPTEELLAREQAEAMARGQQPAPQEATQGQSTAEQEQREAEAKRDSQGQEQEQPPSWLEAPQNEGILSHPTPEASPASPGKEQHQQAVKQAVDQDAGEGSGGMKRTISTKTQLGAVVTLDGAYVVPRYQTVIKETPLHAQGKQSILDRYTPKQEAGQEPERGRTREKERERERDRER